MRAKDLTNVSNVRRKKKTTKRAVSEDPCSYKCIIEDANGQSDTKTSDSLRKVGTCMYSLKF
eukprot:373701-Amphidinium_carterae.1